MSPSPVHTILTHRDTDIDEIEAIRLLKRYGESLCPGITVADIRTVGKRDLEGKTPESLLAEGILCVGVGGGLFDEHPHGDHGRKDGDCAATLVAKALGVDTLPHLEKTVGYALLKNYSAQTEEFEIAPLEKLAFRYLTHSGDEVKDHEAEKEIFEACFLLLDAVEESEKALLSGIPFPAAAEQSADELVAAWILKKFGETNPWPLQIFKLKAVENKGAISSAVAKAVNKSEDRVFYWILQFAKRHKTIEYKSGSFDLGDLVVLAQHMNYPMDKIEKALDIFLTAIWSKYRNFFVYCRNEYNSPSTHIFPFVHNGKEERITSVLSANPEIAKYCRSEYGKYSAVVIKRDPNTGNTQVFFNQKTGIDPKPLVKALRVAEREKNGHTETLSEEVLIAQGEVPGAEVWYFDGFQILNGSHTAEVAPTKLSREETEFTIQKVLTT